jgi:hypothetical protein
VSRMPGDTAFTRMPELAYVADALFTNPSRPAFAEAIASWLGVPMLAAAEDTKTAAPGCDIFLSDLQSPQVCKKH